ncbi:MAG: methyl-accepting chemotaxis protein [Burkholderiales bacterium]|nr:methyl-accepting chemotaxis protein [Burkholderiales bacterium]
MSIKRNIWALPALSTVIFVVGISVSVYFSTRAIASIQTTQAVDYPVLDQIKALQGQILGVTNTLRDAVGEGDKSRLEALPEHVTRVQKTLQTLGGIAGQGPTASRLRNEFDSYHKDALAATRLMLGLDKTDDPKPAIGRMQASQKALDEDLATAIAAAQAQFEAGIERSASNVNRVIATTVLVAGLVILCLVVISWFVVRAIWRQLGGEPEYAQRLARAVADGDLSMHIVTDEHDHDSLLASLREMQSRLHGMVSNIQSASHTIRQASIEITDETGELASHTDTQLSNLEETARAMEALTETVQQNGQSAQNANRLSDSASDIAIQGGEVVGKVVTTMHEIHDSASKIVDIISVIDGIAFQTNILALNAAVEAARAGEQGRGFAVVAAEVRALAQRSAQAAKEIKTLIQNSTAKIAIGAEMADQAGHTMREIVASVRSVTDIIGEITRASAEQSAGILEINQAVRQVDEMTQRNGALVGQASEAATALREQTEQLNDAVSVFKLSAQAPLPEPVSYEPAHAPVSHGATDPAYANALVAA